MPEYIYIGSTELEKKNNYFKIGKTIRDVDKRIKDYQTGRSKINEFFLIASYVCKDCDFIEKILKQKLKPYQDKGEMFHIPLHNLKEIIEGVIIDAEYINDDQKLNYVEYIKKQNDKESFFKKNDFTNLLTQFQYNFNKIYESNYNKKYYIDLLTLNLQELRKQLNFLEKDLLLKKNINEEQELITRFIQNCTIRINKSNVTKSELYATYKKLYGGEENIEEFNKIMDDLKISFGFTDNTFNGNEYWSGLKLLIQDY